MLRFFQFLIGWFGLRRNLCEIILDQCPFLSLYFNNRYKFGSDSPRNDTISAITKNVESIIIIDKTTVGNSNKEDQFMSLLQPD